MNAKGVFIAQAVRGPVLLITIGTLFAMHQAGVLPIERTWPLILIVLGIMKLIERMVVPQFPYGQQPYAQPPYGQPPYGQPPYGQPYTPPAGQPGHAPPPPPPAPERPRQ